jgi:hypothetical protein
MAGERTQPEVRQLNIQCRVSIATDGVAELQKLGGARVILATAPNPQAISALVDGLSPSGQS